MKRITLVLLLVLVFTFTACGNKTEQVDKLTETKSNLEISETLDEEQLPIDIDGVTITWISSVPNLLTSGYMTIPQTYDTLTTLTAVLSYDGKDTIKSFIVTINKIDTTTLDLAKINTEKDALTFASYDLTDSIVLPIESEGIVISWSSNKSCMSSSGVVTRPADGEANCTATLTGTFSYNDSQVIKDFEFIVYSLDTSAVNLAKITTESSALEFSRSNLYSSISLPVISNGVTITWSADNACINNTGDIVRPADGEDDCIVVLTGTFAYDGINVTRDFTFTVKALNDSANYVGYYLGAEGLEGEVLKTFLYDLIKGHTFVTYGDLRDALQVTDADPDQVGNIILLYTGDSISGTWDSGSSWNREHVWPRSLGDMSGSNSSGDTEYSDMHHLRPANPGVNGLRSNFEFDNADGSAKLVNGTDDCYTDSDSFEPRDEVKGDVARMIFYMAVRYEGENGEIDLEVIEAIDGNYPTFGKLSTLIQWHLNDLPDEFELNRNEVIFGYQANRNPFIDHPEFVQLIWN